MTAFLNPALLVALPLALIPLWLRPRPKRIEPQTVPFAATHLLATAAAPVLKRRRLRHWLVTTLRILIIALAVLGFARPYHPRETVSTNRTGPAGVTILANPRHFVEAARGPHREAGPNQLVFLGVEAANRRGGTRSEIAFHPADGGARSPSALVSVAADRQ